MEPEIRSITERRLIGMRIKTSISFDHTAKLWQEFISRHREISNRKESGFYSLQVYPEGLSIADFTEETEFTRWAAVEVENYDEVPAGMMTKTIPAGTYAIFIHTGPVKTFVETSNYVYGKWLPDSLYELDNRPHFERLGEKYYGPEHPESEEELWVPIRNKESSRS